MINIAVRGDSGNVVASARAGLEWAAGFAELDPAEFPMLWALTPYGDAIFNQRQVPLLVAELGRLPVDLGGDWVAQAFELCQVVERGLHLYLWFIGD